MPRDARPLDAARAPASPAVVSSSPDGRDAGRHFPWWYGRPMADESILDRIEALVDEEHALLRREQDDAVDEAALADDRRRLERVSVELDRCWDLLRQRRARRDAGGDPDGASLRDAGTVGRYEQ
jgi:hypothetical protein